MSPPRVRFAPSPTGYLHIGGVRAALYAWLWARQHGGEFVLRVEDTDVERNTEESVEAIFTSLRWLGIDWDEGPEVGGEHGPYFQTERLGIYREHADRLVASGHAYRCFATKEEIQAQREAYEKEHGKKGFKFRSPWRDRTDGDASQPHTVRFKAPSTGTTGWDDLVKGRIDWPNAEQQDFVLLRPNGLPVYNFGCVVDDHTMGITLVTRGEDHTVNTPIQLLIYEALGATPPQFAHMPMVLGHDGKKLSKRHASVSVLDYRDKGYLPDAMLNYLVRLGWSHGDQEIFTRQELIEKFDWDHVGATGSKFDEKKLGFVQAEHLRAQDDDLLVQGVLPFLALRGLETVDERVLRAALPYLKPRAVTFVDLADAADYFLRDVPVFDEKAKKKFLVPANAEYLRALTAFVTDAEPFDATSLADATASWLESKELKMKHVAQPARVALTGRTQSPGLFEVMEVLGKERTLTRLRAGISIAEASA